MGSIGFWYKANKEEEKQEAVGCTFGYKANEEEEKQTTKTKGKKKRTRTRRDE